MKRVCPACKSILTESSICFCEFCGEILPENIQIEKKDFRNVRDVKPSGRKKSIEKKDSYNSNLPPLISLKSVVVGMVLGISISIFFYLLFNSDILKGIREKIFNNRRVVNSVNKSVVAKSDNKEVVVDDEVVEMGLGIKSGKFSQYKIRSYVPYDTPLYFEFNDISTLEPYFSFLGGDFFTLTESIKGKTSDFYSIFYLSKGLSKGWVILTYQKDTIEEIRTSENIFTEVVENILIISTDLVLIDEVKLAKAEVIKNLSMHPVLISTGNLLPKEGQIFVFKNTDDGGRVVAELIKSTTSKEFNSVLKKFEDTKSSYLVIK